MLVWLLVVGLVVGCWLFVVVAIDVVVDRTQTSPSPVGCWFVVGLLLVCCWFVVGLLLVCCWFVVVCLLVVCCC